MNIIILLHIYIYIYIYIYILLNKIIIYNNNYVLNFKLFKIIYLKIIPLDASLL